MEKIDQVEAQVSALKKFIGIADTMVDETDAHRPKLNELMGILESSCEAMELIMAKYRDGEITLAQMKEMGRPHVVVIDRDGYKFGLLLDKISGAQEFEKEAGEYSPLDC